MESSSHFSYFISTLKDFKQEHSQRDIATLFNLSESTISKMLNSDRLIFVCLNASGYFLTESKVIATVDE